MLYVDCDSHILPDDAFDEVAPEFRAQGPKRVADMTMSKFDTQVLVPNNGPFYYDVDPKMALSVCRSYNNSIGRIVKRFPDKFFGLVTLPLQDAVLAAEELERCIRDLGLHA